MSTDAAPRRQPPCLVLVTDGCADAARLWRIVHAAIGAGLRGVQVREPAWGARELASFCAQVRPLLAAVNGVLLVNDRCDVAAAGAADGAQVGRRSLPPALARRAVGAQGWLGVSAHDAVELADAAAGAADFALLSPVWPTASKPGMATLGVARAGELTAAAQVPVLWLGGVTAARIAEVRGLPPAQRPVGFAALGAILRAADPAAATAELLRAIDDALRA